MSWQRHHTRSHVLREVETLAARRRDGVLPWEELDAGAAGFDSPADLLRALHMRWHTRLRARVDRELDRHPLDVEAAVARAWRETAADLPGTRTVLDAYACDPELGEARTKELGFLAHAAGLAAPDDPVAPVLGDRVLARGQEFVIDRQRPAGYRMRLIDRVRQAVVA